MSRTGCAWLFLAIALFAAPVLAADPSVRDEIVYRASLGRADDVKLLLSQGASPDETNKTGVPLLSLAATREDEESLNIVNVLVAAKADINKPDPRGQTPLFYAAKNGNKTLVEYLLKNDANYAAIDRGGNTARNIAFQAGHNDIVDILDTFVRGRNEEARKQYEDANKQLEERYRTYNETVTQQKTATSKDSGKNMVVERIKQSAYDISFSSCALAYWTFCSKTNQTTELGAKVLASNISAQRNRATTLSVQFMKMYNVDESVLQKIVNNSVMQITQQLYNMQNNDIRTEQGVGTLDDMNTRCGVVAGIWAPKP